MSIPFPFQLQVNLQNDIQQPDSGIDTSSLDNAADDDIDAALSELQLTLGGSNGHTKANDITHIPELTDYLRFLRYIATANQLGTMGATLMFSPLVYFQAEKVHIERLQTLLVRIQGFVSVFV